MNVVLDRRVTIQRRSTTRDATYNSEVVTWIPLETVWAELRDVQPSRSESIRSGLNQARDQTRVRIRYRSDIDSTMRILDGIRVLQIVGGPAELGRREFLEMMTETYKSEGGS